MEAQSVGSCEAKTETSLRMMAGIIVVALIAAGAMARRRRKRRDLRIAVQHGESDASPQNKGVAVAEQEKEPLPPVVKDVVDAVAKLRDGYRTRAKWHRRWFRSTGVAVVVLSTTLPLLVIPDYGAKKALVSVVGVTIALLTGLRNFYQWDQLWSLLRQSDFDLTYLLEKWRLDVEAASGTPTGRADQVNRLTLALRDAAEEVRSAESTRYFGSLRFPSASG